MECKALAIVRGWQRINTKSVKKPQRDVVRMVAKDLGTGWMQISLIKNNSDQQTISIPWSAFQELILEFDRVEDAGEVKEVDVEKLFPPKPRPASKVDGKAKRKRKRVKK